ncbi:MAG TPA: hypothetical protein VG897_15085 [Terriglobales bacterium]|nr:hypothetical protein [Terriglobales bacterium]
MAKRTIGGLLLVMLLAMTAVSASAQNAAAKNPKKYVVGLLLTSNYARIGDFLPQLTKDLVKKLPERRKQVQIVAIDASAKDPEELAKNKGCDYLLQLNVSEVTGVGVGAGFDTPTRSFESEPEQRERRELDWVRIDYHLLSVNSDDLSVSDIDEIRYAERPSAWDAMAFESTVSRAVTRVAVASLGKLPKK